MGAEYRKSRRNAPRGFFECEGKGLEWLGEAQAQGGPRVVKVYGWGDDYLDIERVTPRCRRGKLPSNSVPHLRICMMRARRILDRLRRDMTAPVISAPAGSCADGHR